MRLLYQWTHQVLQIKAKFKIIMRLLRQIQNHQRKHQADKKKRSRSLDLTKRRQLILQRQGYLMLIITVLLLKLLKMNQKQLTNLGHQHSIKAQLAVLSLLEISILIATITLRFSKQINLEQSSLIILEVFHQILQEKTMKALLPLKIKQISAVDKQLSQQEELQTVEEVA